MAASCYICLRAHAASAVACQLCVLSHGAAVGIPIPAPSPRPVLLHVAPMGCTVVLRCLSPPIFTSLCCPAYGGHTHTSALTGAHFMAMAPLPLACSEALLSCMLSEQACLDPEHHACMERQRCFLVCMPAGAHMCRHKKSPEWAATFKPALEALGKYYQVGVPQWHFLTVYLFFCCHQERM